MSLESTALAMLAYVAAIFMLPNLPRHIVKRLKILYFVAMYVKVFAILNHSAIISPQRTHDENHLHTHR